MYIIQNFFTLMFLGEDESKLAVPIYMFLLSISDAHIWDK